HRGPLVGALQVLADPRAQVHRLSDVDRLALGVLEEVDARPGGQRLGFDRGGHGARKLAESYNPEAARAMDAWKIDLWRLSKRDPPGPPVANEAANVRFLS